MEYSGTKENPVSKFKKKSMQAGPMRNKLLNVLDARPELKRMRAVSI